MSAADIPLGSVVGDLPLEKSDSSVRAGEVTTVTSSEFRAGEVTTVTVGEVMALGEVTTARSSTKGMRLDARLEGIQGPDGK
jgi:hypothetical protein